MITDGRSMLPAIKPGTVLMINRLAYGIRLPGTDEYLVRWSLPRTGDVVVFITPQGIVAVKRVAVKRAVQRAIRRDEPAAKERMFFALGDNSLESYDSRSYGPVSANRILGKVIMGVK
jgi:signal peptidase I